MPQKTGSCQQEKESERLSQQPGIQHRRCISSRGGKADAHGDEPAEKRFPEKALPPMIEQRSCGGGQEKQQIDALGSALGHIQEQCQDDEQQRAAAHAPGSQDPGAEPDKKRKHKIHSRYFTPA